TGSNRTQGWLLMQAPAVAYSKATPYAPITSMLASYFGVESTDDAPKIRAKVTAKLLELDPAMHWAIAPILSLGNIVSDDADDAEYAALEPPERRRRIFGAVSRIVLRESERRPVLIVVENAHWIDTETAALVDLLVEQIRDARVMLLATYRSEHRPPINPAEH